MWTKKTNHKRNCAYTYCTSGRKWRQQLAKSGYCKKSCKRHLSFQSSLYPAQKCPTVLICHKYSVMVRHVLYMTPSVYFLHVYFPVCMSIVCEVHCMNCDCLVACIFSMCPLTLYINPLQFQHNFSHSPQLFWTVNIPVFVGHSCWSSPYIWQICWLLLVCFVVIFVMLNWTSPVWPFCECVL